MRNQVSIEIDRPIDEVFRLTNEHVAEWSIIVVEDEVLDEKPEGVGTTFRTVTEDHGKRLEFQGIVTRYDPPRANAVRLTGTMFDIETEFTFEDLSGRTRVTQTANVTGKGFFKLFMFLFGWMMNKSKLRLLDIEECYYPGRPDEEQGSFRRPIIVEPLAGGDPIEVEAHFNENGTEGELEQVTQGLAEMVPCYTMEMAEQRPKQCCIDNPGHEGLHTISSEQDCHGERASD